ncbi:MAG: hypothetical protein ACKKL5_00340 [Candidatus Komeilibacteria bacterium]
MTILQWLKKKFVALRKWLVTPNPLGHLAVLFFVLMLWLLRLAAVGGYIPASYADFVLIDPDMTRLDYYIGTPALFSMLFALCFFCTLLIIWFISIFVLVGAIYGCGEYVVLTKKHIMGVASMFLRSTPEQLESFKERGYHPQLLTYRNMVRWLLGGIFIGWWRHLGQKLKLRSLV